MTTRRTLLLPDTASKPESAEPCCEQPTNDRALFHLALGQAAQAEGMWYEALEHYAMGLSCAPKEPRTLLSTLHQQCPLPEHAWNVC